MLKWKLTFNADNRWTMQPKANATKKLVWILDCELYVNVNKRDLKKKNNAKALAKKENYTKMQNVKLLFKENELKWYDYYMIMIIVFGLFSSSIITIDLIKFNWKLSKASNSCE